MNDNLSIIHETTATINNLMQELNYLITLYQTINNVDTMLIKDVIELHINKLQTIIRKIDNGRRK